MVSCLRDAGLQKDQGCTSVDSHKPKQTARIKPVAVQTSDCIMHKQRYWRLGRLKELDYIDGEIANIKIEL